MKLPVSLANDLKRRRVLLFAGAGISAALDLPNWAGLIRKMAEDLGFDPELFEMLGQYPSLAEYYLVKKPDRNILAQWLAKEWHGATIDISKSTVHTALVDAKFPVIYTTNYDHWIERAHDSKAIDYSKIVYGEEIADISETKAQIVKFHGDLDHPSTMVLTEADYFQRLRFEAELDIKLRYDILRYSVLFVGYSLSDVNIRNMLYRLSVFRKEHGARRGSLPQSYIFLDRRNEVQTEIFKTWGIDAIIPESVDRREALIEFMSAVASTASH